MHGISTSLIFAFVTTPLLAICLGVADFLLHYHIDWAKMNLNKKLGYGPTTHEQFWWLLGLDQLLHALTYLGSLVELSDSAKYYLLAGAVTGGGLTVIANAPNPAGYGILKDSFEEGSISPLGILKGALIPTLVAVLCFGLLPSL